MDDKPRSERRTQLPKNYEVVELSVNHLLCIFRPEGPRFLTITLYHKPHVLANVDTSTWRGTLIENGLSPLKWRLLGSSTPVGPLTHVLPPRWSPFAHGRLFSHGVFYYPTTIGTLASSNARTSHTLKNLLFDSLTIKLVDCRRNSYPRLTRI